MFITEDGGLTGAGYAIFIIAAVAIFVVAAILVRGKEEKNVSAKKIAFCGMAIAVAYVLSYIRLFKMPWGGSVTLCSMLFIVLIGYWYGAGTGILVGVVYGILQFIQEPYFLTFLQVCCDYLFAFAALGVSGFFNKKKNGLLKGYIAAVLCRGVFNSLAGYLYWMEYMPENFPKQFAAVYPIAYNYAFLLAEGVITVIILLLPPVKKAMASVKRFALE